MPKTFLHLIPNASYGGTEKDCYFIISELKEHNHLVYVLGVEGEMIEEWQSLNAQVYVLNILRLNPIRFATELRNKLADIEEPAGIFYWSNTRLPWVRYALQKFNTRLAVHVGNPISLKLAREIYDLSVHFVFGSAIKTKLFACSNYVSQSLLSSYYSKRFDIGVSLNPVKSAERNPYVSRKLTADSTITIGMTARLDPIKDHVTLIKSFNRIRQKFPNAKLELLGDGVLKKSLMELVNSLGLNESVLFRGFVRNPYTYLKKFDLFIYSTTIKEGLGNAVSEALANGLPVVASDLPMIREIDAGSNCIAFVQSGNDEAFANESIKLLIDDKKRKNISRIAFKHCKEMLSPTRYAEARFNFLINER